MYMNVQSIPFESVMSVYTGKANKCCCGCSCKHTYVSAHRDESSKSRGYAVEDHEINDSAAKRIYNQIINDPNAELNEDYGFVSLQNETRLKIVYFKKN
jgi:hypothetical protein